MVLFDNINAFLQRVQQHATDGYIWYVSGAFEEADYIKVSAFSDKINAAYDVDISPMQRTRRKKAGYGNVHFLGVKLRKKLVWILLATDGDNDFHLLEKGKKNLTQKKERLSLMGFELVQLTKPSDSGGGSSWTWRLVDSQYKVFESKIDDTAKRAKTGEQALEHAKKLLLWLPMFRGLRVQVGKLFSRLRKQWVTHHGDAPLPKLEGLPFIKRQKTSVIAIVDLCADTLKI